MKTIQPIPTSVLFGIVIVYAIVAALYAIKTPAWQVPDEPAHYNYVAQLVQTGALPVLQMGDWDNDYLNAIKAAHFAPAALGNRLGTIRYEDHQPPLYYLLQAPVYALTGGSLTAMRLFSALIGVGVILVAYAVIRTLFPAHPYLALATAAFVAFLPQHIAMLAGVENDSLAELLIGLTVWVCVIYIGDNPRRVHPGLIGLLLGLALITKVTAYLLIGIVALALLLRILRTRPPLRQWLRDAVWIAVPALILGGIWWVHCIQVYGFPDVLGLGRHNSIVIGQERMSEYLAQYGLGQTLSNGIQTSFHSFWGQFGWMEVPMPGGIYTALLILTIFLVIGAVIAFVRFRTRLTSVQRDGLMVLAALVLGAVAEMVYYNLTFVQFQGRYTYPGLIGIAFFVAVGVTGWTALIPVRAARWIGVLALCAFVVLDVYALYRFILPTLG
ncbi:MAG: DUF2142 domain-containing protein [Aggregatilineales bacterium]